MVVKVGGALRSSVLLWKLGLNICCMTTLVLETWLEETHPKVKNLSLALGEKPI